MRSILSGSVLLLFWSLTINLFLQEAEHETAFSCRKSSVMVYYEHLVRFFTSLPHFRQNNNVSRNKKK